MASGLEFPSGLGEPRGHGKGEKWQISADIHALVTCAQALFIAHAADWNGTG